MISRLSLAPFLIFLLPVYALAQKPVGEFLGRVTDQTGAVIVGGKISVTHVGTGQERTLITDDTGTYHATLLPIGEYRITAEVSGFKRKGIANVILHVNEVVRVDIQMEVGEISEVVEVKGTAPLTKTDAVDVGQVIEERQITRLPFRGENSFTDIVTLDAGVVKPVNFQATVFHELFGGTANAYGSQGDASSFTIDGVDVKDAAYSRIDIRPSKNAVTELKSQSNSSTLEGFGRGGLEVNIVTKSGTNEFHGDYYWDHRNAATNARKFFDPTKQFFLFNQFGGSIGGPIKKDKLLFFFNYQGTRERKAESRFATVAPVPMRTGDFSSLLAQGIQIFDPLTFDPATGRRQPFAGNIIPPGRIHPVARNMLFGTSDGRQPALFPLPDRPGLANNLFGSRVRRQDFDQFIGRIDFKLSQSDTIFGRYILDDQDRVLPFNRFLHQLPNFTDLWNTQANSARIGWTRVVSTRFINEVKLGFMRSTQFLQESVCCNTPVAERLGIQGTSKLFQYNPWVIISGFSRSGGILNGPNNRSDNTYIIGDTASYTAGPHALSFGAEAKRREMNGGAQPTPNGSYVFTSRFTTQPGVPNTGFALADFLLGYPTSAAVGRENGFANFRQNILGFFVQDTWKATPRLTLNLGLGWDYYSPWSDTDDRMSNFNPAIGKLQLIGDDPNPGGVPREVLLRDPLVSGDPYPHGRRIFGRDLNNFAPRVGFAYRPFGNNDTVIRAGYGLYYTSIDAFHMTRARQNRPFVNNLSFFADPLVPNFDIANPFPEDRGIPSAAGRAFPLDWRDPYSQQWNLFIERALTRDVAFSIGYIGNKGTKLKTDEVDINDARPGPGPVAPRRPFPSFTSIGALYNNGSSSYHGLRVGAKRQFAQGFQGELSYVWSKWLDCGGNGFLGEINDKLRRDQENCRLEWGRSIFDARHRFVYNTIWMIPYRGKGAPGAIFGYWGVSSIGTFSTGGGLDVVLPFDNSNRGTTLDRPDLIGDPNKGAPHTPQEWFNTKAFAAPQPFSMGTAGRNIVESPGFASVDFSIFKDWRLDERKYLGFRVDFFNAFNRVNFDVPDTTALTPVFGRISNTADPRILQWSLRFGF